MRKITLSLLVGIFALVGIINLVSAGTQIIPDYGNSFEINNFQINPTLTITDVINLCVQESCIINEGEENNNLSYYSHKWKTVTIRSHYDKEVALILKYDATTNAEGTNTDYSLRLTTTLPYKPNQACIDYAFEPSKGCEIISTHISPQDYNWKESVKTDLNNLRELKVIDLSNDEIEKMSSLADAGKNIQKFKGEWVQVGISCIAWDIQKDIDKYDTYEEFQEHFSYPQEDLDRGWSEQCPVWGNSPQQVSTIILPQKEYGIQENVVVPNQEDTTNPSTSIYWIIGVVGVIIIVILVLVFMRKKK